MNRRSFRAQQWILSIMLFVLTVGSAVAQSTTATIRGRVSSESGEAIGAADIIATSTTSGFTHTTTSRSDGSFTLGGLTPGTYTIVVASAATQVSTEQVTVLIGQTLDLVFRLTPSTVLTESITVVGDQLIETRATEVSTNITRQQIESLPQSSRNFLNFAGLAPGVVMTTDDANKQIKGGAQTAAATNVFIDGVSYKNDIIQGGVVGQDSSRGNPFPQNAVQEFRVITQNYSAEYQKASSAIITAITRSGSNKLSGDVFVYYQDKSLVDNDPFAEKRGDPKPPYERLQYGVNLGGPIMRDRMHFFASFEANDQDRQERVTLGGLRNIPFAQQFRDREGTFTQPFRSKLGFGKLSFQPTSSQLFDLSASIRDETDIRSFGGSTSYESAENIEQTVLNTGLRHQFTASTWLNEASLSYQDYNWHPQPLNNTIGREYIGIIRIGGRGGEQEIGQKRISFRDDVTFTGLKLGPGSHTFKVGGNADDLEYTVRKDFFGNPFFLYRQDISFDFPFEAQYGIGDPNLSADNQEFGLYVQDEWSVNPKLLLNLGIRWDYETNMLDPDYVTPADVRAGFSKFFSSNYFTDGTKRSSAKDLFQPRLGASYDVFENGRTVVYGGVGRYYDRVLYNDILDVRFRQQYKFGLFRFSADGRPRDGQPTVKFDPRYLTEAGLREVLASGVTGSPEVFLVENDTKVPYSDQWNIGVRQSFGSMVASASYANIRSKNGFSYIFGNRNEQGQCCKQLVPGFGNVLLSTDDKKTWYDAVYLTLDRPYSGTRPWGFNVAYTFSNAEQIGGDLFSLDEKTVNDFPRYAVTGSEDHRLVVSGTIGIPWAARLGSIIEYGSGPHYNIGDATKGFGPNEFVRRYGQGEGDSHITVDLRGEKDFVIGGTNRIGVILEAFNVLGEDRTSCYEDFIPPQGNPRLGEANCILSGTQRRFQLGLRYGF
ncbi:MAG TPA: TonB-dependent receptor [Thermoanaerobaculia bacterium]|nr:TonB-dependent receptor [Thermoanaerobaculia bacterium]